MWNDLLVLLLKLKNIIKKSMNSFLSISSNCGGRLKPVPAVHHKHGVGDSGKQRIAASHLLTKC